MEAQVVFNPSNGLFDLVIEIDGIKKVLSTSKSYGHWQYHFNRGTLSKSLSQYKIDSFVYVGFVPSVKTPKEVPVSNSPLNVQASWFESQMISTPEVKKRGRPRKHFEKTTGSVLHKFDDEEVGFKLINALEREVIERNFKMFIKTMDLKEALEELALKFQIPYKQAFELTQNN